ncbi:hypothetical protein [Mycolicibacterium sp. PDY-3]|uniref:hypothetical protein n=1 Tax=Mycolicibacterium sp. PDY-3 TaxID=3376069 RepID=UPI00379756EE
MHEIMKREQARYAERIDEQCRLERLTDEQLNSLVKGNSPKQPIKERQPESIGMEPGSEL